ncbi:unnamed protein product [Clonostachys rhizophaga]|uniref:General negative regulator of transcription subunit 4 n=1 Tax=Clonostachys rhizophaga TaxID=160324 RepID=A0A9N9YDI1_9HYPO|nr:unnamed protein product [Clonostachys rhizophaga]
MAPQDSFIEEEGDTCPLCIEDFDLSDRNFRPCPCGYQVCQFCFNNIKNNMNGLCPACRRPYDEKTIQYKVVTTEEVAEFRANIQKNQKKRAQEQRQKEAQKREAEKENRKNLVGVRVVQKNLVYITGLAPTVREDELLKTLRKPEFFGQYGNIQKISISNRKSSDGQHQSLGIYVTFEKPEEATKCIQAVHGSQNGDRYLKAQHGTTKYCSAWLKNEKCNNPGCMFLHEQGDDEDSYTRQDLSSMNSIHTQRPLPGGGSSGPSRVASRQLSHPTPPPQAQPAAQAMARSVSKDGSDGGVDSSALPSSANWARNPQRSRRGSHATSAAASSPAVSAALVATAKVQVQEEAVEDPEPATQQEPSPQPQIQKKPSEESWRSVPETSLKALIKILHECPFPDFRNALLDDSQYPPLFDIQGGERRRAMREEDDLRINGEQEEQVEAIDQSEGEPEAGGSLALGGEPEEREVSGESLGFEQRRPGTQPPIQRTNTDGPFGPALGASAFGQTSTNPVTRTMTPQQIFNMRSQGGFNDQMPPGISNQTNLFQSQGHNRQSSRFNFANESGSSVTNIKLSANPRIMAQQSSMMPNSFQSQGNQYYASSMPGPPPGLKSTGTPPNMFGQSGFAGSAFAGTPKDSSNDLLQTLIGRTRGANSQAPDTGKREYMISSFSNQYPPSTSTPAPAPGLLSLYGTQPGAFQDFGSKQKKKGKKHRHANTSSSGGSGLVDLADPSILQARMQHQPQSNAGAAHGLFGGQSQDDDLPSLDEATSSVDALVSDDTFDTIIQSGSALQNTTGPSVPPGFDDPIGYRPPGLGYDAFQNQFRFPTAMASITPGPPPGLSAGLLTPEQTPRSVLPPSSTETRQGAESLVAESGLAKIMSGQAQADPTRPSTALQEEDFPALNAPKSRKSSGRPSLTTVPAVPTPKGTPALKKQQLDKAINTQLSSPDPKSPVLARADVRRAETPSPPSLKKVDTRDNHEKPSSAQSTAFPPLPIPSSGNASPSATRAPKTLRLLPIQKMEVPPVASPISAVSRALSQTHRPGTPGSEMVSDTASIVSASVSASRAGSPPPSRVGAAAVRTTTKSQQRKQRKDALKQDTKAIAEAPKPELEEHAPVLGRKKKQKKEKARKTIVPQLQETAGGSDTKLAEEEKPAPVKAAEDVVAPPAPSKQEPQAPPEPTSNERKIQNKGKAVERAPKPSPVKIEDDNKTLTAEPTPVSEGGEVEEGDKDEKPQLGPFSIFIDIKDSLWTATVDKLHMLKPVTSTSSRAEQSTSSNSGSKHSDSTVSPASTEDRATRCKDTACKCGEIQDSDLTALRAGKPVRKQFHVDGSRMLITPNGDCVRGLTVEEENTFLDLQNSIAGHAEHPGAYVAARHQPGSGAFSLIKGRAVPNGRPNIFPATSQPQTQDPIGKLQREDALSYINQYVLPRLNLGPTNVGWPKGATLRQDAAAASLNSLAPYFYGPDAAAGVGIYSAPDGKDFSTPSTVLHHPTEDGAAKFGNAGVSGMPLMSVEDAEGALIAARKETEKLEKGLNQVIKRNRRLLVGTSN